MAVGPVARFFEALTTIRGATLAVPAILLVGALLALVQNAVRPDRLAAQTVKAATVSAETKAGRSGDRPAAGEQRVSTFTPEQRKEIEAIIKDYLTKNPEVMLEIQNALEAQMEKIQSERMAVAIRENAKELFRPERAPIVGNAKGDVTVIEFFDYNCGYCRRALPDLTRLVENDKQVKLILKEFPILSKGSEEASRVALAARMQGKYWEFHRAMLETPGQANEAAALRVAGKAGLDVERLKKDMASPEIKKEIEDTRRLANKMGIQGTPHFLVGERVIPGAPENLYELLKEHVSEVRKSGCQVC
jgi:protein-disulfide isomerase